MARIVVQEQVRQTQESAREIERPQEERTSTVSEPEPQLTADGDPSYWLTPVSGKEGMTPEEVVYRLVGQDQIYGYGKRTPGRKDLSPGDRLAFYASGEGVVAHAVVASSPEKKANPDDHLATPDAQDYPYIFQLRNPTLYLDEPVVIDESLRGRLEAFEDRDLSKSWSWFVQSSREFSKHDFKVLTR